MGRRGRKAQPANVVPLRARPAPSEDLTESQAAEWRAIVAAMPPDWFDRGALPQLAGYVRHADRARRLAAVLDGDDGDRMMRSSPADYRKLAAEAREESRCALACARSLRLTTQSRYDARGAGRKAQRESGVSLDWAAALERSGKGERR